MYHAQGAALGPLCHHSAASRTESERERDLRLDGIHYVRYGVKIYTPPQVQARLNVDTMNYEGTDTDTQVAREH